MTGLLSSMVVDHDPITGVAVNIVSGAGRPNVTSAGLFTPAMDKRQIVNSGSGGSDFTFTYIDASNGSCSSDFTQTGARTFEFNQRRVVLTQQQVHNPALSRLLDPSGQAEFKLPAFTTGPTGLVKVEAELEIFGSGSSADNLLVLALLDAANAVVVPARRVNLENASKHPAKLDRRYQLTPLTAYGPLYLGIGNGNQTPGAGSQHYEVEWGGGKGAAIGLIWDLLV